MNPESRDAIHSVYTLECALGVYVGCTVAPQRRLSQHFSLARSGGKGFRVHRLIRKLGPDAFVATVVAQTRGRENGFLLVREVTDQVVLSGVRLLNTPAGPRGRA